MFRAHSDALYSSGVVWVQYDKRHLQENQRGAYAWLCLTKDLWRHDFGWIWLFAPFPYATKYEQFLRIPLCAPMSEELGDWAGWVKSRFRHLILKLEAIGVECDPDSSEEVDHSHQSLTLYTIGASSLRQVLTLILAL